MHSLFRSPRFLAALLLIGASGATGAEELREHPTPFTAWLDFGPMSVGKPSPGALPIWLESVRIIPHPAKPAPAENTTFRIRLRRVGDLNGQLQVRLFFEDRPTLGPVVTGWSETGSERYRSEPLGTGLGLPTSETLRIPAGDLDYLDIDVPGNGANLRGAFLATLKKAEIFHALDFAAPTGSVDPFSNLPKAAPASEDSYLYGRVKATIEPGESVLSPADVAGQSWEFELDSVPLLAMASFEVLNASPLSPPEISVNGRLIGPISIHLPDLGDPAYQAVVRPNAQQINFTYGGWLRAQSAIPGGALRVGLNKVTIRSMGAPEPVALRGLELQLKHHWQYLDYKLVP